MLFWKKHDNTNQNASIPLEYDRLLRRLSDVSAEIELLKTTVKVMQTDLDNLRGNFNRKLKGLEKEEKTEENPKPQNIYTSDYVAFG